MRLAILAVLFSSCLNAAAANLSAIYKLALDHDAQFAAAREAFRAGVEKRPQGKALYRPSVTGTANVRATRDSIRLLRNQRISDSNTAALSVVQPIWRMQNAQSAQQGEVQAQIAEQQFRQAEQELLLRVARAYFDVLQAQDVLVTLGAQKQAFSQQLAQTRRSFEVGTVPITDVHEAQARFDLTVAQEIAASNDLEVKRGTLEKIISREPPSLARLDERVTISAGTVEDMTKLVELAPVDGLAVILARLNQQLARHEAAKQRFGRMPTIDLSATASTDRDVSSSVGVTQRERRQEVIGLELSWPLYQGGAISSREREAAANLSKAGFELDAARKQASFEAREAYLAAMSGAALQTALKQALLSSQSQVNSTRRGFEVGVRTRVDVLNAEQQLYTTKRDLAAARYQTLIAGLQVKAVASVLSEQDFLALDKLLRD